PILNRCNVRKERTLVAQLDRFAINHVIADRSYSAENFSSNLRYFHLFTVNHLDAATRDDDVESDLIVTRKSINPLIGKPLYFIIINHRTQPRVLIPEIRPKPPPFFLLRTSNILPQGVCVI